MRKKITYGAILPVAIEDAFAFVSDPRNWSRFLVFECTDLDDWGREGGRARTLGAFMGREVASELELTEWDPPHRFRYTMRTPGLPELDNLRVFEGLADGTRFRGSSVAAVRPGLPGMVDRVRAWALKRVMDKGMQRLPVVVASHRSAR